MSPADIVPSFRPYQAEAIQEATTAFATGKRVVILEAPTGFGKSIANVAVARRFQSTYYITHLVPLVDQIASDPLLKGLLSTVYGKRNYDCVIPDGAGKTVDRAPCEVGMICKECKGLSDRMEDCERCRGKGYYRLDCESAYGHRDIRGGHAEPPDCPYHAARFNAVQANVAAMTLSYFMLTASDAGARAMNEAKTGRLYPDDWGMVDGRFPMRDLLVVDEAHGVADFCTEFQSLTLSPKTLHHDGWKRTWEELVPRARTVVDEDTARKFLSAHLDRALLKDRDTLGKMIDQARGSAPKASLDRLTLQMQAVQQYRDYVVNRAIEDLGNGNPWAVQFTNDTKKLQLRPVDIGPILRSYLWSKASHALISSATVLDPVFLLKELGLDVDAQGNAIPFAVIRVPSTFDPKKAPIYDETVGLMTRSWRDQTRPQALERLQAILALEPRRGIIHCHSYDNQQYIRDHIADRFRSRLVFHGRGDRNPALKAWMKDGRPDSVLVSVNMTEGLDLKDDLARFAVLWKVPYPSLGDPRVSRRMKMPDGKHWYALQTLRSVIQGCGRIVRSPEDEGRVYVLDTSFKVILNQTLPFVPPWFIDRLRAGGFKLPTPIPKMELPEPNVGTFLEL